MPELLFLDYVAAAARNRLMDIMWLFIMWALETVTDKRDGRNKGWQRRADTVITIIDVICLSFISANGCSILFLFCWVLKLKYANCDAR